MVGGNQSQDELANICDRTPQVDPLDEPIISSKGEPHSLDMCKYECVNRDLRRPTCVGWFFTLDFFIRSCISYPLQLQLSDSPFKGISPLKSPSLTPIRSRRILGDAHGRLDPSSRLNLMPNVRCPPIPRTAPIITIVRVANSTLRPTKAIRRLNKVIIARLKNPRPNILSNKWRHDASQDWHLLTTEYSPPNLQAGSHLTINRDTTIWVRDQAFLVGEQPGSGFVRWDVRKGLCH